MEQLAVHPVHPFFDLGRTDRARWVALFCDSELAVPSGLALDFPLLPRGESPLSWLEDQYRRAERTAEKPDRLRDAVVDLLRRELDGIVLRDRLQVMGTLVDLASACGFTEIEPKLRDWIRGDNYARAIYLVDSHPVPLRQTLWSTIIAWGVGEEMMPYLKRDLGRPELGCGALCFSALGRLSPFDAIAAIPSTCVWPLSYWVEVLRGFFENFSDAARMLVEPHLQPAWQRCLAELSWDPEVSEYSKPYMFPLLELLEEAGLDLRELLGEDTFYLRPKERELAGLRIDLASIKQEVDEQLLAYYQGLLEGASRSLEGTSTPPGSQRYVANESRLEAGR
jgi:hypothetical protein